MACRLWACAIRSIFIFAVQASSAMSFHSAITAMDAFSVRMSVISRNVWFSRDCHDCNDCFGCVNLRSKQYYIYNQPYTKESYKEAIKSLNLGSYASIQEIERQG